MLGQVNVQPGCVAVRARGEVCDQLVDFDPRRVHDFRRVGRKGQGGGRFSDKDIDHFMLYQAIAHVSAVFGVVDLFKREVGNAKLFGQATGRACRRVFVPQRMGAAGIRPKAAGVVFAEGAASKGVDADLATKLFDLVEKFAGTLDDRLMSNCYWIE